MPVKDRNCWVLWSMPDGADDWIREVWVSFRQMTKYIKSNMWRWAAFTYVVIPRGEDVPQDKSPVCWANIHYCKEEK